MDKSLFYTTMCSLLDAGFPPIRALRSVMPAPFRRVSARMAAAIEQGTTLTEAMRQQSCFSPMEVSLIHAGERSGTIPDSCRQLQEYFTEKKNFRAKIISGFAYPLFLYHFAGCIFTLLKYLSHQGNPLIFLIEWTAAPWVILLLWKILSPLRNSTPVSLLIAPLPFLGSLHFQIEITRFLTCFGRAQEAGIGMTESVLMSSQVCESALYRQCFENVAKKIYTTNRPLTECAFDALPKNWPEEIQAMLQTGEATGELPLYAERAAKFLKDRIQARMTLLAKCIPFAFYLVVVLQIAVRVIGFYSGYINILNELLE